MRSNQATQPQVTARRVLIHGETYRLPKDASGVRVRSGRAWLSVGGEDFVLGRRDEMLLGSREAKTDYGVVSPVGQVPLLIEVLGVDGRVRHDARLTKGQRS